MSFLLFKKLKGFALGLASGAILVAGSVQAAPSAITLGDFSGSETIVDFNTIGDEEQITSQYAADICVTFSGAIYGMTNTADTAQFPDNGGGVIASNWLYEGGGLQGTSFSVDLGSRQSRVGFYVETNDPDDTMIEVVINGGSNGSVWFDTNIDGSQFIGVEDPDGIDGITVTVENEANGFLAIDDLRFEGGQLCSGEPSMVPVPTLSNASMLMLVLTLLSAGLIGIRVRGF